MMRGTIRVFLSAVLAALPVSAQDSTQSAPLAVPFGVGERMEYDIKFGRLHVGTGDMEVLPMDTVRGRDVWHTVFRLRGGIPFYHVNDRYEVWSDTHTLSALRYWQDIDEGNYEPKRHYEIFPDRREYIENEKPPRESVGRPLVEGSFLYILRTLPLRVGMDTSFNDYFMAERNPVRFKVLRRDTVQVPAGRFPALVVQPIFESKLFNEGGHAEVWLSDDPNHIMLQMKSRVKFGSLSLYLKSYRPSPTATTPVNRMTKPGEIR
jgi:hypothetical protein